MTDPRTIGGTYHCGYWHFDYQVLAIDGSQITVKQVGGSEVGKHRIGDTWSHFTAWDESRDRMAGQPCRNIHCAWGR